MAQEVAKTDTEIPHEKSCGAVVVNEGKVLLICQHNGLVGFPKGHMEPGETEIETAKREVWEETGLLIEVWPEKRYSFEYYIEKYNVQKEVVLFVGRPKEEIFRLKGQEEEVLDLDWTPIERVEEKLNFEDWKEAWRKIRKML